MSDSQSALDAHNEGEYLPATLSHSSEILTAHQLAARLPASSVRILPGMTVWPTTPGDMRSI